MAQFRGAGLTSPLAWGGFRASLRVAPPRLDGLAASVGVETERLQRASLRAGLGARHPILYASFDELEGPQEATPSTRRLAGQALKFHGLPPPAPRRSGTPHGKALTRL